MIKREWGKTHREAGKAEERQAWQEAMEQAGIPAEQKAKIEKAVAAKQAEKDKDSA